MTESSDASGFATGSHDLPVSEALLKFMAESWADTSRTPQPLAQATYTAKRRAALSARFPGERLVIPAGGLKVRSNDCDFRFRPHSAYTHLTGDTGTETAPDSVLVLEPTGTGHEATLFLHPRSPRDTGEAFRDRRYGEFWVGRHHALTEAAAEFQIGCEHIDALPAALTGITATRVLRDVDPGVDALISPGPGDEELASALAEMRLVKDEWEAAQLQQAVDHTVRGFEEVVSAIPAALRHRRGERWIEGIFALTARAEGNGVGYETIAASGAHACVLHWIRNDGALKPGDLLLLDAGVETDSLYTADITRTLPLSGTFSPVQRQVYDLVHAAQSAGIAALRPGARFRDFHLAAMRVIAEGLESWGIIPSAEQALDPDSGLYRRYTLCSSGHMLGLDVHDCAKARASAYLDGVLEAGQVLTVEPGLYLQPDDLTLPEELRGIGVRIEDDLIITQDGARLMSSALPREADALESWMASLL